MKNALKRIIFLPKNIYFLKFYYSQLINNTRLEKWRYGDNTTNHLGYMISTTNCLILSLLFWLRQIGLEKCAKLKIQKNFAGFKCVLKFSIFRKQNPEKLENGKWKKEFQKTTRLSQKCEICKRNRNSSATKRFSLFNLKFTLTLFCVQQDSTTFLLNSVNLYWIFFQKMFNFYLSSIFIWKCWKIQLEVLIFFNLCWIFHLLFIYCICQL